MGGAFGSLQRLVGFAAHGLGPATIAQRESKEIHFGGHQTMPMYGKFERFPCNGMVFGLP